MHPAGQTRRAAVSCRPLGTDNHLPLAFSLAPSSRLGGRALAAVGQWCWAPQAGGNESRQTVVEEPEEEVSLHCGQVSGGPKGSQQRAWRSGDNCCLARDGPARLIGLLDHSNICRTSRLATIATSPPSS